MTGHFLGPRRQWRRAGAAFGLVAVATAVLAGVELTRDDPQPSGATSTPSASSSQSPPSAPPTSTQPSVPDPTGADPAAQFRCWTGARVASLDGCAEPNGAAGLAWVFPSLDPAACTNQLAAAPVPQLRQLYECRARAAGQDVNITYVEWRSVADALNYFDAKSPRRVTIRGPRGRPLRFSWVYVTPPGDYTGALSYTDAPFSVVVRAPDAASRSAAEHDLIRLRRTAELTGVPLRG
ncbi:hypothetical protein [Nocardioides sp.]|uniref:hypothetical protein n=1 Tax=Nocardioides sp. TaxID=35761 RepID=UPI0031FF2BFB|nr:hypothetical protein [Nocardioides sp.]